jgi:tRNA(Ile)-lysidine synthase
MSASFSDDEIAALFRDVPRDVPIALAVSGGGDSVAMLALARRMHGALTVLTVDHGLRPESADEAAGVARLCDDYGITHETLHWQAVDGGNLAANAREGRYRLMAEACRKRGICVLLTGHTLDDQAETVLMRLGRGSGVDGMAGIRPRVDLWGVCILRPLLGVSRQRLRHFLKEQKIGWIDDPSNEDRTRTRIMARDAVAVLSPLGMTPERLSDTAARMADARIVLEGEADRLAGGCTVSPLGHVTVDPVSLTTASRDTAHRLLARILCAVSGQVYRPRLSALTDLLRDLGRPDFAGRTLHGCRIDPWRGGIAVQREPAAGAGPAQGTSSRIVWDRRFEIVLPTALTEDRTIHVAACGEAGLAALKAAKTPLSGDWRDAPRPSRLAAPAVWRGNTLLGIPFAGYATDAMVGACKATSMVTIAATLVDPDVVDYI